MSFFSYFKFFESRKHIIVQTHNSFGKEFQAYGNKGQHNPKNKCSWTSSLGFHLQFVPDTRRVKTSQRSQSAYQVHSKLWLYEIYVNNSTPKTWRLELLTPLQNLVGWVGQRLRKCHASLHQHHAAGRGMTEHLITSLNLLSQTKAITQSLGRTDS